MDAELRLLLAGARPPWSADLASKISGLDLTHDSVELTEDVFATFPGLAQMLPRGPISNGINWHEARSWPASPRVVDSVLDEAATVASLLAHAADNWSLIAGVDQETIARGEQNSSGGFRCQRSFLGDGTVPLSSARLPELRDAQVFYVKHGHGTLPMNSSVNQAVIQLLKGEPVTALSNELPQVRPAPTEWLTDDQMRSRSTNAARAVHAWCFAYWRSLSAPAERA